LTDGLEVIEFPAMNHGWSIRGDLSMKEVERDVKKMNKKNQNQKKVTK